MSTLTATPGQTIGPFFGYALPFERGNELVPPGSAGAIRLHGVVTDGADAELTVGTGAAKYTVTSPTNTFSGLMNDTTVSVSGLAASVTVSVGTSTASTASDKPRRSASAMIESRTLFSKPE